MSSIQSFGEMLMTNWCILMDSLRIQGSRDYILMGSIFLPINKEEIA